MELGAHVVFSVFVYVWCAGGCDEYRVVTAVAKLVRTFRQGRNEQVLEEIRSTHASTSRVYTVPFFFTRQQRATRKETTRVKTDQDSPVAPPY